MLLAEALIERADAQRRLSDLRNRVTDYALVQEGEDPAEDPQALLEEARTVTARIHALIAAVNATNAVTTMADGRTVTAALAYRDQLSAQVNLLVEAANATSRTSRRLWGRSEIRDVATLDARALRDEADRLGAERRALDNELQQLNWRTELVASV